MSDTLRPPAKATPRHPGGLEPVRGDTVRRKFIKLRNRLGWSQLRASIELGVARSTIECWESARPDINTAIPAWAYDRVRLLARELFGADSMGRIKVSA